MGKHGPIPPEKVRHAREWWAQWQAVGTFNAKARELGITRDALRQIVRGANYRWVP